MIILWLIKYEIFENGRLEEFFEIYGIFEKI